MSFFRKLERFLQPLAVPHVLLAIVAGQTFFYLTVNLFGIIDPSRIWMAWSLVGMGEWWRIATFVFDPPSMHWAFFAFGMYCLYSFGSSLEHEWGTLRFNLFLLSGLVLTLAVGLVDPAQVLSNVFISGSVFLAFAYLNPEYQMYVYFILPVRAKYLAAVAWFLYLIAFWTGGFVTRLAILAAVGNFFLFLGAQIVRDIRAKRRHMHGQLRRRADRREAAAAGPRHRCVLCAKNSDTHPHEDFRYCSKCAGDQCYCEEHLRAHVHIEAPR